MNAQSAEAVEQEAPTSERSGKWWEYVTCVIDRFYSALYPTAPKSLKKTAMFLSSGDPEMYDGAKFSYEGDFLDYLAWRAAVYLQITIMT